MPVEEPLVNQILGPGTALHDIWPVCTTLSKTTSHLCLFWPGCVRKLKLALSGLDAGKFLIVQLPSIWICEGATGVTKPSSRPPRSLTQSSACAGAAPSSDSAMAN